MSEQGVEQGGDHASIDIEASPEAEYAILTDLSPISELSPECYKAEWEGEVTGLAEDPRFRGHNTTRRYFIEPTASGRRVTKGFDSPTLDF